MSYLRLFQDIPDSDEQLLTQILQFRSLAENEVLVRPSRVSQEMFFVVQGVLRVVGRQEDDAETIQFFCTENHLCMIAESFIDQAPAIQAIQAACPTQVLILPRTDLLNLYAQLPYFQSLINQITQRRLLDEIRLRNQYMGKDALARYQQFLQCQPEVARRVSLRDVASYLGITQQSLSRIRRQLAS